MCFYFLYNVCCTKYYDMCHTCFEKVCVSHTKFLENVCCENVCFENVCFENVCFRDFVKTCESKTYIFGD